VKKIQTNMGWGNIVEGKKANNDLKCLKNLSAEKPTTPNYPFYIKCPLESRSSCTKEVEEGSSSGTP
jgi:hypothetical protein